MKRQSITPNRSHASYQIELNGERWACACGCAQLQSITTHERGSFDLRCSRCNAPVGFLNIVQVIRPP